MSATSIEKQNLVSAWLGSPLVYRLWQAPFVKAKLAPLLACTDLKSVRAVLDIGCGPGTNTKFFQDCDYLGLDLNERYIADARRRYGKPFEVADIRYYRPAGGRQYDFILMNSFLHHLDDESSCRILDQARALLATDGCIHIMDLVMPDRPSIAKYLASNDRGNFPRSFAAWKELFSSRFQPLAMRPYTLRFMGITLWHMVYFKGRL